MLDYVKTIVDAHLDLLQKHGLSKEQSEDKVIELFDSKQELVAFKPSVLKYLGR